MWTEQIKGITLRPLRAGADEHVLVALVGGVEVGVGCLVRTGARAEVTVVVADGWQRQGVGTVLADRLAADARAAGLTVTQTVARRGARQHDLVFDTVQRWQCTKPSTVSESLAG